MFGRGNKTNKILGDILLELRRINAVTQPAVVTSTKPVTPAPVPEIVVKPVSILDRPLARDGSITLRESLLNTFARGKSVDSIVSGYASFTAGDLDEAVDLLVRSGDLETSTARTTVNGESATRIIYRRSATS
jgi:hypothetical protein